MWMVSNTVAGATCLKLVQAGVQAGDGDFCKGLSLQALGIVCLRLPKLNVGSSILLSRSIPKRSEALRNPCKHWACCVFGRFSPLRVTF